MNGDKAEIRGVGTSFVGLLTIAFIVLKLCDVIDWSWWWVISPIWISCGIAATFIIIFFTMVFFIKNK